MEAISSFSREKTLLKRGRDPPKFTAVISLIVPRHNLFFTRGPHGRRRPHSHSSPLQRTSEGTAVPWPFAGDATRLLSSELLVAVERQQARKLERDTLPAPNEVVLGRKWNVYS